MRFAIGIDIVETKRCERWSSYRREVLLRVFSPGEVSYCLSNPCKSAERFAVRFAAKEACYKALSQFYPTVPLSLLSMLRLVEVIKADNGAPVLLVQWSQLKLQPAVSLLSLTHAGGMALAQVVLHIP